MESKVKSEQINERVSRWKKGLRLIFACTTFGLGKAEKDMMWGEEVSSREVRQEWQGTLKAELSYDTNLFEEPMKITCRI